MAHHCTNPDLEFLLLKEVATSHAQTRQPQLSIEMTQHLAECGSCRSMFPEWLLRLATWD